MLSPQLSECVVQAVAIENAGEVFGLLLDIVETARADDVKACLTFMDTIWDKWSTLQASLATDRATNRLAFQKVYNVFCQRISNNQDAEILGAVANVVAKMMPYNDPAGLNTAFHCNQRHTPMDDSIGVRFWLSACMHLTSLLPATTAASIWACGHCSLHISTQLRPQCSGTCYV